MCWLSVLLLSFVCWVVAEACLPTCGWLATYLLRVTCSWYQSVCSGPVAPLLQSSTLKRDAQLVTPRLQDLKLSKCGHSAGTLFLRQMGTPRSSWAISNCLSPRPQALKYSLTNESLNYMCPVCPLMEQYTKHTMLIWILKKNTMLKLELFRIC